MCSEVLGLFCIFHSRTSFQTLWKFHASHSWFSFVSADHLIVREDLIGFYSEYEGAGLIIGVPTCLIEENPLSLS